MPIALLALLLTTGIGALGFALYAHRAGNTPIPDDPQGSRTLPTGEFAYLETPRKAPDISFDAPNGRRAQIADFIGHPLLINFWATWCGPCAVELPSLLRLAKAMKRDGLMVIPIALDRGGWNTAETFLKDRDLSELTAYADPTMKISQAFTVGGLPTTVLVDENGFEIGRLVGPAEWDSPEIVAKLREKLMSR